MAKQTLDRLCVVLLVDEEGRQRVAKIVKPEALPRLEHSAGRNCSRTNSEREHFGPGIGYTAGRCGLAGSAASRLTMRRVPRRVESE